MGDICFAMRPNKKFYVGKNECYALDYPVFKKMKQNGICGTTECPFYKPRRKDIRVDDSIRRSY